MGLWIVLAICLVIVFNLCFHLFIQERWSRLTESDMAFDENYGFIRQSLLIAQGIEIVLFCVAIVALAVVTSHRIAGPYIRLKSAFTDVRDGNMGHFLKFRSYDHLEKLETSFNEMMETVRARTGTQDKPNPGPEGGDEGSAD